MFCNIDIIDILDEVNTRFTGICMQKLYAIQLFIKKTNDY